jgi:hypothetical protein
MGVSGTHPSPMTRKVDFHRLCYNYDAAWIDQSIHECDGLGLEETFYLV